MSQQTSRRQNGNREPPCRDPPIHRLPMQADKRRGAGCDCCDFAVRVNDFLTVGRSPIVGKCFSAEGLLTTTQVVGNKPSVSVEQQSYPAPRRVLQRSRLP